jgi:hypothetical protein
MADAANWRTSIVRYATMCAFAARGGRLVTDHAQRRTQRHRARSPAGYAHTCRRAVAHREGSVNDNSAHGSFVGVPLYGTQFPPLPCSGPASVGSASYEDPSAFRYFNP